MNNYIKLIIAIIIMLIIGFITKKQRRINKSPKLFYSTDQFPITKILEDNWESIAKEYMKLPKDVMIKKDGRSKNSWYGDDNFNELVELYQKKYGWINAWQDKKNNVNNNWMNWGLYVDNKPLGYNSKLCPITTSILSKIPGIQIAGFSVMKPNSMINPHTDTTGLKFNSMAYHLGLDVPNDGVCELFVDNKHMKEKNGKAFLFDATFLHYAKNTSKKYDRAILYIAFDLNYI